MRALLKRNTFLLLPAILIAVLAAFVVFTTNPSKSLSDAGFIILGALLSIFTTLTIDVHKRHQQAKDLARILYEELSDRVARCCFDYEAPWEKYRHGNSTVAADMPIFRIRKFAPQKPVLYLANANQLALLPEGVSQAISLFYFSLSAWQRDIDSTTAEPIAGTVPTTDKITLLSYRLSQTLAPGLKALEALAPHVANQAAIEAAAIAGYEALTSGKDSRTLRARLVTSLEGIKATE